MEKNEGFLEVLVTLHALVVDLDNSNTISDEEEKMKWYIEQEKKVIHWLRTRKCENVKTCWINGVVTVGSFLLVPCSPHLWTVVSGKTWKSKTLGRNCLLWQCPSVGTVCQAFMGIPLFLLLPVTQISDKYTFNAAFQYGASHSACRMNTDGLRVRLRQSAWLCGNICFTKLLSALGRLVWAQLVNIMPSSAPLNIAVTWFAQRPAVHWD